MHRMGRGVKVSCLYISIAYYMQKGGGGKESILVNIIAYVLNGRTKIEVLPDTQKRGGGVGKMF